MTLSRRDLLKLALLGAAHPLLPVRGIVSQAFAAPGAARREIPAGVSARRLRRRERRHSGGQRFLLRVAADDSHPTPDAANPRAAIALARPATPSCGACIPALKDSMMPLWKKGQLAFVPFAGTEDLTRSHFETQDSVESGMPVVRTGATRSYGSGFLNRLAAALDGGGAPVAFTDGLPMVDDRRPRRAERVPQGHRQAAVRRSADADARRDVRGHAFRTAHRGRLRSAEDRRGTGRDDGQRRNQRRDDRRQSQRDDRQGL